MDERPGGNISAEQVAGGAPHWLKVLSVAVALFLFCQGPFIYGWATNQPGYRFTAANFYALNDPPLYWWWMEEGRAGSWVATSPFTTGLQPHGTFMPMWTGLGQLGRLLNVPSRTIFVASTLIGIWLALLAIDWLARAAGLGKRKRLVAVLLAAGAGGFGWLANVGFMVPSLRSHAIFLATSISEVWEPAVTLAGSASISPHFPLLEALLTLNVGLYLWQPRRRWLAYIATAVTTAALGTLRPYSVVVVFCLYLALTALAWWKERPAFGEHLARVAAVGLGALLPASYFLWLVLVEPTFAWWLSQNNLRSAAPFNYIFGLGLLVVLVTFGALSLGRKALDSRAWRLIATWVVLPLFLLYVPFFTQRRASDGWYVPIAVVAAVGWAKLSPLLGRHPVIKAIAITMLCLTTFTRSLWLTVWYGSGSSYLVHSPPQVVEAMDWLKERCAVEPAVVMVDDLYLSSYVPFQAGCYSFSGHDHLTVNFELKRGLIADLMANSPTSTPADRAWLARSGARYVLTVKTPRLDVPELSLEWGSDGAFVYRNNLFQESS